MTTTTARRKPTEEFVMKEDVLTFNGETNSLFSKLDLQRDNRYLIEAEQTIKKAEELIEALEEDNIEMEEINKNKPEDLPEVDYVTELKTRTISELLPNNYIETMLLPSLSERQEAIQLLRQAPDFDLYFERGLRQAKAISMQPPSKNAILNSITEQFEKNEVEEKFRSSRFAYEQEKLKRYLVGSAQMKVKGGFLTSAGDFVLNVALTLSPILIQLGLPAVTGGTAFVAVVLIKSFLPAANKIWTTWKDPYANLTLRKAASLYLKEVSKTFLITGIEQLSGAGGGIQYIGTGLTIVGSMLVDATFSLVDPIQHSEKIKHLKILEEDKNLPSLPNIQRLFLSNLHFDDTLSHKLRTGQTWEFLKSVATKVQIVLDFTTIYSVTVGAAVQWLAHQTEPYSLLKPLTFANLIGMKREKREMLGKFVYPNVYPLLYKSDKNNVLMFGPPGTGKTMIAKSTAVEVGEVAKNLKIVFFSQTADNLRSKWEGGTEKNIAALFSFAQESAVKAKEGNPLKIAKSIIFLDEVEAIAADRESGGSERSVTTLLQQMDGAQAKPDVIVMAATNFPWKLDAAFLRRFSAVIFIDLPDFSTILNILTMTIFKFYVKNHAHRLCNLVLVNDMTKEDQRHCFFLMWQKWLAKHSGPKNIDTKSLPRVQISESSNEKQKKSQTVEKSKTIAETEEQTVLRIRVYYEFLGRSFDRPDVKIKEWMDKIRRAETTEALATITIDWEYYFETFAKTTIQKIQTMAESQVKPKEKFILPGFFVNDDPAGEIRRDVLKRYKEYLRFLHFVSEYMGPHDNALQIGAVLNRPTSVFAASAYGYSASDIDKVITEIFSLRASRLVEGYYMTSDCKETVCNPKDVPRCFETATESSSTVQDFSSIWRENNTYLQSNETKDKLMTFYFRDIVNALSNYVTTTGNDDTYYDHVCYNESREGPDKRHCRTIGSTLRPLLRTQSVACTP